MINRKTKYEQPVLTAPQTNNLKLQKYSISLMQAKRRNLEFKQKTWN